MRSTSRVSGFLVALVGAIALAACDDGPTRPSPPPGGGGTTPPPAAPPLLRITVDGPASVAPGESAQFTATGHYSDGSTRNVTTETGIAWRSSITRILSVSSSGVATGGDRGEASITATFTGRNAVKSGVLVLPPGTYRLMGTVTDTGFPLSNVRVEVTHGPAAGMVTTASPTYRLYGVAGDTELRVQKDGYRDERPRVQVANHQTMDIELTPSAPRENVEGTYTLTVTADPECPVTLPEQARVRTFTAALRQQGPRVTVTLEGSTFLTLGSHTHNSFSGTLEGDRLTFFMTDPFYYYFYYYMPDVIELLTPTTYLYLSGSVTASRSGNSRSGSLSGLFGTMEGPPRFRPITSCRSNGHRFELVRR
jgi:hypothetical protein